MKLTLRKHGELAIDIRVKHHLTSNDLITFIAHYLDGLETKPSKKDFLQNLRGCLKYEGDEYISLLGDIELDNLIEKKELAETYLEKWFK